jgi:hypothetical protein
VPEALAAVFERAAEVLATGDAIAVVPVSEELTQQAADLLGVSRQYLVRLLDAGRLPSTRTGTRAGCPSMTCSGCERRENPPGRRRRGYASGRTGTGL